MITTIMHIGRQKDEVVILQPHLILESPMAMAVLNYFVYLQWNNEMACTNFLELLQLPMKKQGCYKVAYDEQNCNNLVTRLYNAITHLYDNKL